MKTELHHGDCLEVLRTLADNSLDSLVTDPPAGISFMGKAWDDDKGGRDNWIAWLTDVMRECHRVLKPGAHGLVWALPRTSHWTATALENAGFEIRDVVTHLFGTGFPKSLDISKAIDKAAGAERKVVGKEVYRKAPTAHASHSITMGATTDEGKLKRKWDITAPATDDAKRFQGWGTALKPAAEFWWLIRKPLSEKTVAANVLKHGTGGINVDGCRVSHAETIQRPPLSTNKHDGYKRPWNEDPEAREAMAARKSESADKAQNLGRFPANLVLSHNEDCEPSPYVFRDGTTAPQCTEGCAVAMLDEQSGTLKSGGGQKNTRRSRGNTYAPWGQANDAESQPSSGGASRFFYCAKASKSDRNRSVKHVENHQRPSDSQEHITHELFDSAGNPTRGHSA